MNVSTIVRNLETKRPSKRNEQPKEMPKATSKRTRDVENDLRKVFAVFY